MEGTQVSHYRIAARIGSGGMGVVYRAEDTRLGRAVALKFLPEDLFVSERAHERFRREARTASSLNHPHICTVYDVGEHEGQPFLVMELLEGSSLRQMIGTRRFSTTEVIDLADQIADALDAAHRHGVVHRDIKPSNIFVTSCSQVKVLDFGLAKITIDRDDRSGAGPEDLTVATEESLTQPGLAVGTPAYMSPEQTLGDEVDGRSDLFSLGVVLYEMATGRPAFTGTSLAIAHAIVHGVPVPPLTVAPWLPRELARVLDKALEKDRDLRYQDASDLRADLRRVKRTLSSRESGSEGDLLPGPAPVPEWDPRAPVAGVVTFAPASSPAQTHTASDVAALATGSASSPAVAMPPRRRLPIVVLGVAAVVAALATGARFLPSSSSTPVSHVSRRLFLQLPDSLPLTPVAAMPLASDRPALALSPDGRTLVYAGLSDRHLMLVAYDTVTESAVVLPGTEGAHSPFFSPDGTKIGFFARGKLWTQGVGTGAPSALADADNPWGGLWGRDGLVYFNPAEGRGLLKIDPGGGGPQRVISSLGAAGAAMPSQAGRGDGVLAYMGNQRAETALVTADGTARVLFKGFGVHVVPGGHAVYATPGKLMAIPFDAVRSVVTGAPVALADDLRTALYGVAQFTVSNEGTLVYVPGRDQGYAHFVRVNPSSGARARFIQDEARYGAFSVSPDGKRLAAQADDDTNDPGADIWIYDLSNGARDVRLGGTAPREPGERRMFPRWAPDSEHLVYGVKSPRQCQLVWSHTDGSDRRVLWEATAQGPEWLYPMSFSPDGRVLAVFGPRAATSMDLYTLAVRREDGTIAERAELRPYLATAALESLQQFSPDNEWMAFASTASRQYEVYVARYPVPGTPCRVSTNGGVDPTWLDRGRTIAYQAGTAVVSRAVVSLDECRFGPPQTLFEGFPDRPGFGHDLLPDGSWLMLEVDGFERPVRALKVITNVFDELRARAPASLRERQ